MKRQIFTLFFIFLSIFASLTAQDSKKKDLYPWSFSFSYSPKLDISEYQPNYKNGNYTKSFSHMIDHRFKQHLSYSFGININFITDDFTNYDFNGIEYNITNYSQKTFQCGFPFQLNYHFLDTSKYFDPYIKISLINSFYYSKYELHSSSENSSMPYYRYYVFIDLGFGNYLKISNRVSFIYETSVGVGIKCEKSGYIYIQGLLGLRYKIK